MPLEGRPANILLNDRSAIPVPEPPFGKWTETAGILAATGLTNCWSTMLLPEDRQGGVITARLTVNTSCGAERQLAGGCVRWGFHWGENLPGWDVGIVFGYQDPLNFYRLQLSAARGEMALWDATGGLLQLIPCPFEAGKPHDLTVRWQGAHVVVEVDGKPVMDYWDRTLPYTHGRVGLAVWKSDVRVERFQVAESAIGAGPSVVPPHIANFHFERTRNILSDHPAFHMMPQDGLILFDGYEPISYFWKQSPDAGGEGSRGTLFHEAVKLKPGWRPTFYTYIGPNGLLWLGKWPMLVGTFPDAFKVTESGSTLGFTFQTETPGTGSTDYACSVTFDSQRGVYRYEYRGTLKVTAPAKVNEFELYDPHVYNNRMPGPEVVHTWNPAGHRWWVYQGTNGLWERMPLTDYPNDYSTDINNAKGQWGKVSDFLYPDPAACPLFETTVQWPQPEGRFFSLGQCSWGYDYHHREMGSPLSLKAGDVRSFVMTFTALPPAEAEKLMAQSRLMPCLQNEKRVLIPFIPTGTTFAVTTTWQDPSSTMVWIGGTRDVTTGHGDSASLRIDGPGKTKVQLYQYIVEQYAKRWWLRGWIKTKDVAGQGVTLRVKYSYGKETEEVFKLGSGTRDWTPFSVITTALSARDSTDMTFELDGAGQVWMDDVALSALNDKQNPPTTTVVQK
jgi:hypothetical protein